MDYHLVEKFFDNTCTQEEAEYVLDWLTTPEGQAYLNKKLEDNIDLLDDERIKPLISKTISEEMWAAIEKEVESANEYPSVFQKRSTSYWRIVAGILIVLTSSMLYYWSFQSSPSDSEMGSELIHYKAGNGQQRALTLNDGTKIRLNSNSEVWISEAFGQTNRKVTLRGEGYFEVVHDKQKPFIIHTSNAYIKDLGTAFNVRALPNDDGVQVAVTEGKVSLWSDQQAEEKATELNPGQFGHLSLKDHSIEVDEFSIDNYLSWMSGRIEFKNAPLSKVSTQLSRIYGVSFEYSTQDIKDLVLSSTFERGSLEKALEVIALTLDLEYSRQDDIVRWKAKAERDSNS